MASSKYFLHIKDESILMIMNDPSFIMDPHAETDLTCLESNPWPSTLDESMRTITPLRLLYFCTMYKLMLYWRKATTICTLNKLRPKKHSDSMLLQIYTINSRRYMLTISNSTVTFKTNVYSWSGISSDVLSLASVIRKQNRPAFGFSDWKCT